MVQQSTRQLTDLESSSIAGGGNNRCSDINRTYLFGISIVAALGGLMFGYDWVVIGGAELFYEKYFNLVSSFQIGWAMSSALVGALVGATLSGGLSDRFGRKPLLIFAGALFVTTSAGTGFASNFNWFITNRLISGIAIGVASNLSPLYIAEIAPAYMRGRLVSVNQLTIALGVVAAQIMNWLIARPMPTYSTLAQIPPDSWNVQVAWRLMFGAACIPALVFFLAMFFVPESPRWLVMKGFPERARTVLKRVGGVEYSNKSIQEIEATLSGEREKMVFRELRTPRVLKILFVGVVLAVFQQWCGINVIFQYGSHIFADAGYAVSGALFNIVITGVVAVLMTFVAIGSVDRWGRRKLMLSGSMGLAVICVLTGWAYNSGMKGLVPVLLVVAAIACYCYSLAPITWVILSEIFPNRIRGSAMSIAVMVLWIANFLLSQTFPTMYQGIGLAKCFWVYAAICFMGFLFIWKKLPETKGKSLEEIERELAG